MSPWPVVPFNLSLLEVGRRSAVPEDVAFEKGLEIGSGQSRDGETGCLMRNRAPP